MNFYEFFLSNCVNICYTEKTFSTTKGSVIFCLPPSFHRKWKRLRIACPSHFRHFSTWKQPWTAVRCSAGENSQTAVFGSLPGKLFVKFHNPKMPSIFTEYPRKSLKASGSLILIWTGIMKASAASYLKIPSLLKPLIMLQAFTSSIKIPGKPFVPLSSAKITIFPVLKAFFPGCARAGEPLWEMIIMLFQNRKLWPFARRNPWGIYGQGSGPDT